MVGYLAPLVGNLNKLGMDEKPPLLEAAREGHLEVVRRLLEFGADVERGDAIGTTPLSAAAHGGHSAVVACLVKAGARRNELQVSLGMNLYEDSYISCYLKYLLLSYPCCY